MTFANAESIFLMMLVSQLPTLIAAWVVYLKAKAAAIEAATKLAEQTKAAAQKTYEQTKEKVDQVQSTLKNSSDKTTITLDKLTEVAVSTHGLVNSGMTAQLQLNAALAKRIAHLTNDPSDIAAAEVAEKMVVRHSEKHDVDAQSTENSP